MMLEKEDVKFISEFFDLGAVEDFELMKSGFSNYNYIVQTNKGKFVVRFSSLGNESLKVKMLPKQLELIEFLHENDFEYELPLPIEGKDGRIILNYKDISFWVYKFIEGKAYDNTSLGVDDNTLRKIARTLAKYHLAVKNFPGIIDQGVNEYGWLESKYDGLKSCDSNEPVGKIVLENLDYMKSKIEWLKKIKFSNNLIPCHSDFFKGNLIFDDNNEIKAVIDFDNIEFAPRTKDIGYTILMHCFDNENFNPEMDKIKLFIREYEKIYPLNEQEKQEIIPMIVRENCITFWWFYSMMKKASELKLYLIKWVVGITKNIEELKF